MKLSPSAQWRHTSTPHACLHGVHKDNFAVFLHIQCRTTQAASHAIQTDDIKRPAFVVCSLNDLVTKQLQIRAPGTALLRGATNTKAGRNSTLDSAARPRRADTKTKKCLAQEGAVPLQLRAGTEAHTSGMTNITHSRRAGRREIALLRMKGGDITELLLLTHEDSFNLGNGGDEENSDT